MAIFSCTMALLPYTVTLLRVKSLSGIVKVAEPCKEFLWRVATLEQSEVEKFLNLFKWADYTIGCKTFRIIIES